MTRRRGLDMTFSAKERSPACDRVRSEPALACSHAAVVLAASVEDAVDPRLLHARLTLRNSSRVTQPRFAAWKVAVSLAAEGDLDGTNSNPPIRTKIAVKTLTMIAPPPATVPRNGERNPGFSRDTLRTRAVTRL